MNIRRRLIAAPLLFLVFYLLAQGVTGYYNRQATNTMKIAHRLGDQAVIAERLFRGVSDLLLSRDSAASFKIVEDAGERFHKGHRWLREHVADPELREMLTRRITPVWLDIRTDISSFIRKAAADPGEDEERRQSERILSRTDELIRSLGEAREKARTQEHAEMDRFMLVDRVSMSIVAIGTLLLFLQLYRAISVPMERLRGEVEWLSAAPEELMVRLHLYRGSVVRQTAIPTKEKGNEFASFARSFDALIDCVRDSMQAREEALEQISRFNETLERRVTARAQELNEKEALYRGLFENTGVGILYAGSGMEILDANQHFLDFVGYTLPELQGRTPVEITHPEDVEQTRERFRAMEEGRSESIHLEKRYLHKDGRVRWGEVMATGVRDSSGHISHWLAAVSDITERKEAEQALRAREAQLAKAQELARLGSWRVDCSTMTVYWSEEAREILGLDAESGPWPEVLQGVIHREDRKLLEGSSRELMTSHGSLHFDYRVAHPDKGVRYIRCLGTALRNEDGTLVSLAGVSQDVTDLEAPQRELDRVFNLSRDILCILGTEDRFVRVNPEFWKSLGYTENELLSAPFYHLIHPDDRAASKAEYLKYRRGAVSETVDFENRFRHKDGSYRWFQWRAVSEDGLIYCAIRDVTEQKRTEDELRQAAAVFENTKEGVVITDAQAAVLAVNKAFLKISGFSREEVLGETPRLWKSDRHDEAFYQALWASLLRTGQWRGEIWNRRKDGEAYPAWLSIDSIYDDKGDITNYVSVLSDISAVKQSQEQVQFLAHHDPLTELPNRLLFNARLEHALQRAQREHHQVAVLFLDLDNFKSINDSLGHPVGDDLLQQVAARLSGLLREEDTVARVAGDEFIIILDEVSRVEDVSLVAEKLLAAFDTPVRLTADELHVTVSIGIALFPEDGESVTELVKNADAAMYHSKANGRNRFSFYTSELTDGVAEQLRIGNDLRSALGRGEFSLHYQPQYLLSDGRLVGAEALLRWEHPELGMISPARFIPIAESTGMIIPIGGWVLRTACRQVKEWRDRGLEIDRIGVNIAGQQIEHMDILQAVETVLETTGLDPRVVELEVTETFIMQRAEQSITTLGRLRDMGITLAIDDFGTGYSSLSYLKQLPVNRLKVDKSFVDGIPGDSNDEAITRAVIALAKSLDLEVIAEGVETEEQESFLRAEGCEEVQGYYYSRPLPADEFAELLRNVDQSVFSA